MGDAPNALARESHAQGRRAVESVIEGLRGVPIVCVTVSKPARVGSELG